MKIQKIKRNKFIMSLLITGLGYSLNAAAVSDSDRIAQLERVTNAHSQLFTQLQQQLSANQQDINNLRGELQQIEYKLEQATNTQVQLQQQMSQIVPESTSDNTAVMNGSENSNQATAQTFSTPAANTTNSVASPIAFTGDDNRDYNASVALVLEAKQYDQAIAAFQAFITQYPNSHYLPNANYWLAQSYYNTGNKDEAAKYFASVVKNYPESPKSSDAMLKVGLIMEEKGEVDKAKAVFQEINRKYPNSEAAAKATSKLGQ